jgi:hypothetical protein
MVRTRGLNHVAVSVPIGTLTEEYRVALRDFYGEHLGWSEITELELPDRLTLAVGHRCYLNVREREQAMVCHGYEHVGVLVESTDDAEAAWTALAADGRDVELQAIERGDDGYRVFRFRYLLPLTIEVMHLP